MMQDRSDPRAKHTVLGDPKVRKAINLSIDRKMIMEALYPGITCDLRGNANLYHYGLSAYAEALEMMQAVAASGIDPITSIGQRNTCHICSAT